MKVPRRLRRIAALVAAVLIALGALALVTSQASADEAPISNTEMDWG